MRPLSPDVFRLGGSTGEAELGWRAQESFETGLERTVRWYLANGWWWRPLRERRYAGERLGLGPAAAKAAA